MTTVLIADAERSIRNSLKERLEYEGFVTDTAESVEETLGKVSKSAFDILIFDMTLLYKGGVPAFADHVKHVSPATDVIVLSEMKSIEQAVECMKAGAIDFIVKPIDLGKLLASVRDVAARKNKTSDPAAVPSGTSVPVTKSRPQRTLRAKSASLQKMIGESEGMRRIQSLIDKVGPTESRVLITGPNGTGKELVARWLHEKSSRSASSFVEVNCAAIPSELIESELFGHEKGAFTSAIKQRKGKFEQADGGTLFLDEIGDMSLSAQSKMLRALQESRISRVGSDADIDVNVRVIAATNKHLEDEIKSRNFREDLYHRLSVIIIRVPPLVERRDDIPLLVDFFMDHICDDYGIDRKDMDPQCLNALRDMNWPGNIRQLRNVVERLIVLSENCITLDDVDMYVSQV